MNERIKYVAELSHVREVSLLGTAELGYWEEKLAAEGLRPAQRDGRAQVLIIGAEGRFMGLKFSELSFSVLVDGYGEDAAFLVRAFNSRQFFALCERVFYATPYYGGDVRIGTAEEPSIGLSIGGQIAFRAVGGRGRREGWEAREQGWSGPVFLPGGRRVFFARIAGTTQTASFAEDDAIVIEPVAGSGGVLQALAESGFTPREWLVRADATHAKSKTYLRDKAPLPVRAVVVSGAEIGVKSG